MKAKFTATVLNCGVYDMVRVLNRKSLFINGVCKEFTGLGIDEACKSPYLEAFTLTSSVTDSFPPTLLIYSKSDVFCMGQGELLLHTLEEHNVAVEHICAKSVFDNHVYSLSGLQVWHGRQTKVFCVTSTGIFMQGHGGYGVPTVRRNRRCGNSNGCRQPRRRINNGQLKNDTELYFRVVFVLYSIAAICKNPFAHIVSVCRISANKFSFLQFFGFGIFEVC